jgi:hypothetical protein
MTFCVAFRLSILQSQICQALITSPGEPTWERPSDAPHCAVNTGVAACLSVSARAGQTNDGAATRTLNGGRLPSC